MVEPRGPPAKFTGSTGPGGPTRTQQGPATACLPRVGDCWGETLGLMPGGPGHLHGPVTGPCPRTVTWICSGAWGTAYGAAAPGLLGCGRLGSALRGYGQEDRPGRRDERATGHRCLWGFPGADPGPEHLGGRAGVWGRRRDAHGGALQGWAPGCAGPGLALGGREGWRDHVPERGP